MTYIRNAIVWFVSFLLTLPSEWVLAADPIVVDTAAPGANRATVATTPSGKPMLNIAAPNASGVSHNKFANFNVTSQGLVINNATALANTSLAGVIEANPNFSGSAASLILNEVTSSNRSLLKGATEIGGQAADYILANPNGITCDGCGFINTPRATLTTGTPTFTGTQLAGLSVDVGDILVEGLGLDATKATKFDIVTRAAIINAQINAADLGIHAGRQNFDYTARSGTAKTDDGSVKPAFAIDSTALGGMYAGRITLVGTEAGLGVRVAGDMAASTGDMVLTAAGRLELKSDISVAQDIQLASLSDDIVADKAVYAGGNLTATANTGTVTANASASFGAAGDVTVKAANVTANATGGTGGQFVAGMDDSGALTTDGTLDIQATTQIATGDGFLGAGQAVKLKGPTIDLSRAADDSSETVRSRGTLTIESGNLSASGGRIASDGAMTLTGNSPIVIGAGNYSSASAIALTGDSITTAATMTSDQSITLTSTVGDITNTGSIAATTTTELNAAANITNSGTLESQTGTTVTAAGDIDNQTGAKIKSAATTNVTAGGTLTNVGSIFAEQAATITAPTIANTGSLAGGTDLNINVGSLSNTAGVLHAQDNITVIGTDGASNATLFDNASGVVETVNGDIAITADTIQNRKSVFTAGSIHRWTKQYRGSSDGCYEGDGKICTYNLVIDSPIGSLQFAYRGPFFGRYHEGYISADSAASLMHAGRNISLTGATITNDNSNIHAVDDITLTGTTVNNQGAAIYSRLYYRGIPGGENRWFLGLEKTVSTTDSVIQAGGALTIDAADPDSSVRNGTELYDSAPPPGTHPIGTNELATPPTQSALLDTSAYVDLIPGRNALFLTNPSPTATFVYETRADFIDVANYYGSDYFIGKLGVTPGQVATRLGDAYFDTTLVREAIVRETGKRFLDDTVDNDIQQMKNLLDNAVAASGGLNLAFGISLSAEQIDALTTDIVWYVEEEYNGQTVLVPKVFLASATRATLDDSGAILAGDSATINAASIENDRGVIRADNDIQLTASNDITSRSGKIKAGGDIALTATNGSVAIETQVDTYNLAADGVRSTHSIRHATSTVSAGGNFTVSAANGDIALRGADVQVGGNATLNAGGDVTVGSQEIEQGISNRHGVYQSTTHINSTLNAGGTLDITAGGDAKVQGATVTAGGDVTLAATGDVTIEATADTIDAEAETGEVFKRTDNTAATLTSGGALSVTSGGAAKLKGARLTATNDLTLQATGDVVIESSADQYELNVKTYKKKTTTQNRSGLTAGGDVTVGSLIGNLSVISSELESGGDITLNTPGGSVYLGVRKDYFEEREIQTKSSGLMMTVINRGRIDETVVPTLMTADGNLAIVAANGLVVDYKDTGSLSGSIDQLSQSPGLAWMKDVQARADVDWNAVEEYHHSWDHRSQGISPVGAALISLAVGVASGGATAGIDGWGAKLFGMNQFTNPTLMAATNAGFSSLVSQAAAAVVGNGGDLGAALKDLGSMDAIKALATSMVTAGLIEGLEITDALTTPGAELDKLTDTVRQMAEFTDKLQVAIAEGAISATVDSVINGAPLTDNLKNALASAAVTVVSQTAFKTVGDLGVEYGLEEGSLQKIAMHALTGCAVGEAGSGGCAAGAMAAGLQEMLGDGFQEITSDPEKQVKLAGLIGALAVAVTGGDVNAVNAAANIAETASAYNRQLHTEEIQAIRKKAEEFDGVDGLSAAEWETRLGQAALRRVDLQSAAKFDEDAIADGAIGEIINEYGTQFADSLAASFKFLERDEYYTSSATFSPGLIDPATKGFYDNVYADWATQTYGPDVTGKVAPSQLALLNAVAPRFGSACGSHVGCEFLSPEFADVIDPTQARAMNAVILHGMRRQVGEVYETLKAANGTSPQATQAFNDSRRAYIDLTAAEGVQTLLGSRGAIGAAAKDTLSATANAVEIVTLAVLGDEPSQAAIGDTVTALVDVLSSPQDIPPAIRDSIVAQLNEAQTLYEAGDLQGAGNVAGKLQLTLFGSIAGTTVIAGMTDNGAELLRKIGGTKDALKTPAQVWEISPMQRGNIIEDSLAKSDYKDWYHVGEERNRKFPLVDFQNGKTLVSLKSVDTTGSTWFTRMSDHIVDLGTRGAMVDGQPADMVLDLRVQPGGLEAAKDLRIIAEKRGVHLIIKEFK